MMDKESHRNEICEHVQLCVLIFMVNIHIHYPGSLDKLKYSIKKANIKWQNLSRLFWLIADVDEKEHKSQFLNAYKIRNALQI